MTDPYKTFSPGTPQSEALPGQSQNNAGGYSFTLNDWQTLERFLILGSAGGTYYVGEQKLTRDNAKVVERCLDADGPATVKVITDISVSGRAPKAQPALFALALAAAHPDLHTRSAALDALGAVCRTGTHLFTFLSYVTNLRGKGSGLQRAVAQWYTDRPVEKVAYQAIKYRNREGWSHRDALRIAHPQTTEKDRGHLFDFICDRPNDKKIAKHESLRIVEGFRKVQAATSATEVAKLIKEYNLPWEAIPTSFHNEKKVWEAIIDAGALGLTAAIRQLPRLTNLKVIDSRNVAEMITDGDKLQASRVHPLFILNALETYRQGTGRGSTTWTPDRQIIDALDESFYLAFGNVVPTGKRLCLGLDVSGSMGWPSIANTNISPKVASAALALITAATEKNYKIMGFSGDFVPLDISPRQRLDDVVRSMERVPFGRTDCSLPMQWARANNHNFDAFVVYTDSETWSGRIHPPEALRAYRKHSGIDDAKLIVVGMTATNFTVNDPKDPYGLDVVGFDTATPNLISDFVRGAV